MHYVLILNHRSHLADLKRNNIIFAKEDKDDFKIKIIDFGLARDLEDDLDIPISTCGTPEFTSLEVTHSNIRSIIRTIIAGDPV